MLELLLSVELELVGKLMYSAPFSTWEYTTYEIDRLIFARQIFI
jgi:hypothetical protein